MVRFGVVVAVLTATVATPGLARGAELDQEQAQATGFANVSGPSSPASQSFAQTFTAGSSLKLERVDLHLRHDVAPPNALTVELRDTTGAGAPGSTVLATGQAPASAISEVAGWVPVPLVAQLAAGVKYTLVAYTSGAAIEWGRSSGDAYPAGSLFFQSVSPPGPTWTPTTGDTAFRTYLTFVGEKLLLTTRGCSDWTVPLGVSAIDVLAVGEAGETVNSSLGGVGDGVEGRLVPVAGGDVLGVCVGANGVPGGKPGGDGGGASGVSKGPGFAAPLLVAAGGGGAGYWLAADPFGGSAGMPNGADANAYQGIEGKGASQTGPGAGGANAGHAGSGSTAAGPGAGGAASFKGGGGGAGYFGGGGGGTTSGGDGLGGGGGSDFCAGTAVLQGCKQVAGFGSKHATGAGLGEAKVVLRYVVADAPSVAIAAPTGGAVFALGATVTTSFSCTEGANGPGIASCVDQDARPSGSALNTATAGPHTLTVTARSAAGKTATASVAYTVSPAPAAALRISGVTQSARTWRRSTGTTFSFTLSRNARVKLRFERRTTGRRVGKACVKATRKNRGRKACARWTAAGSFSVAGHAGTNKVRFNGRKGSVRLGPGRYRVTITATDSGKTVTGPRLAFRIKS